MGYNVECKLIIRDFDGDKRSKVSLPLSEKFELYEPDGVDLVSRSFIYAMLGLGHSVKSIKESLDREIHDAIYDQTGVE